RGLGIAVMRPTLCDALGLARALDQPRELLDPPAQLDAQGVGVGGDGDEVDAPAGGDCGELGAVAVQAYDQAALVAGFDDAPYGRLVLRAAAVHLGREAQ